MSRKKKLNLKTIDSTEDLKGNILKQAITNQSRFLCRHSLKTQPFFQNSSHFDRNTYQEWKAISVAKRPATEIGERIHANRSLRKKDYKKIAQFNEIRKQQAKIKSSIGQENPQNILKKDSISRNNTVRSNLCKISKYNQGLKQRSKTFKNVQPNNQVGNQTIDLKDMKSEIIQKINKKINFIKKMTPQIQSEGRKINLFKFDRLIQQTLKKITRSVKIYDKNGQKQKGNIYKKIKFEGKILTEQVLSMRNQLLTAKQKEINQNLMLGVVGCCKQIKSTDFDYYNYKQVKNKMVRRKCTTATSPCRKSSINFPEDIDAWAQNAERIDQIDIASVVHF